MSKKLLHKTLTAYFVYSLLILLTAAPIFFYATQKLYLQEADDTLLLHKKEFTQYTAPDLREADIAAWNKFNRNRKISPYSNLPGETIYSTSYYDTLDAEMEPYRELKDTITIEGKIYLYTGRINMVENEDVMKNTGVLFFSVVLTLLVGLFFITKKLSLHLWKPFYRTLQQIESFEIDKTKLPEFSKTGIEEFSRLNNSIQRLMEKNISIYKMQKEFIENAAHELQTPLALFQAKIDTLMQRPDVSKEQSEILYSLNDNISRLNRLNRNLLLLSKIENDIYSEKKLVSPASIIQKNLGFFTEQATAKNLTIKLEVKAEIEITANPELTDILINNLFLNAIKHNIPGGEIIILINKDGILFRNTGNNYPLQKENLFKRFSKTNPSHQGNGLGLSLIKKIADINSWKITYTYEKRYHSFFILF